MHQLRIKAWDAVQVVEEIRKVVMHCCDYVFQRGATQVAPEQIVIFLQQAAAQMHLYEPNRPAVRARLQTDGLLIIFDNGIHLTTNLDNQPSLLICGVPLSEVEILTRPGITATNYCDFVRWIVNDELMVLEGQEARVKSLIPQATLAQELIAITS